MEVRVLGLDFVSGIGPCRPKTKDKRPKTRTLLQLRQMPKPVHTVRSIPCLNAAALHENPHRQPRRDRRSDHPRVPRDGPADGRGLFRLRPRRAARARRGPGGSHRPERSGPRATCASTRSSTPRGGPGRTPCIPATGSSRRTPRFARACRDAGLTFIGPSPEAIALMGSKTARAGGGDPRGRAGRARNGAAARRTRARRRDRARSRTRVGYPLVVKAVAGGGGKGMRTVDDPACSRRRDPHRALRGRLGVRRHGDLSRAAHRRAAPHRDPAARRRVTARSSRSSSASARSSGATRRWSRSRRRWPSRRSCGGAWRTPRPRSRRRSATPTPARSSSCSTRTARSTSSR